MQAWWLTRCHVHYGIDGWLNEADHYSSIAVDYWVNYWLTTHLLHLRNVFCYIISISINGLMQMRCNPIDSALELHIFCSSNWYEIAWGAKLISPLDNKAVILLEITTRVFLEIWIHSKTWSNIVPSTDWLISRKCFSKKIYKSLPMKEQFSDIGKWKGCET